MKLSELKKQIKELYSLQEETAEEVNAIADAYKNVAKAKKEAGMQEGKITKSQFKEYLRQEILAEISEQEDEEETSDNIDVEVPGEEVETEPITPDLTLNKRDVLDDIGDELVVLAKQAKEVGEEELANQILNSAKFTEKKEFQAVAKDVGVPNRGEQ